MFGQVEVRVWFHYVYVDTVSYRCIFFSSIVMCTVVTTHVNLPFEMSLKDYTMIWH